MVPQARREQFLSTESGVASEHCWMWIKNKNKINNQLFWTLKIPTTVEKSTHLETAPIIYVLRLHFSHTPEMKNRIQATRLPTSEIISVGT